MWIIIIMCVDWRIKIINYYLDSSINRGRSGKIARLLKAPLHSTIRPHGACRLPCTWVNRNVWHVARMSRTRENRVNRIYSSFYFRADCAARAVRLPNQSRYLKRPSPYTITNARRVACNNAHLNAPILLRNIFVSVNSELFCRIHNKPRNTLPVMLDCSQYGTSRFKKYRRCHSLCV